MHELLFASLLQSNHAAAPPLTRVHGWPPLNALGAEPQSSLVLPLQRQQTHEPGVTGMRARVCLPDSNRA